MYFGPKALACACPFIGFKATPDEHIWGFGRFLAQMLSESNAKT